MENKQMATPQALGKHLHTRIASGKKTINRVGRTLSKITPGKQQLSNGKSCLSNSIYLDLPSFYHQMLP